MGIIKVVARAEVLSPPAIGVLVREEEFDCLGDRRCIAPLSGLDQPMHAKPCAIPGPRSKMEQIVYIALARYVCVQM